MPVVVVTLRRLAGNRPRGAPRAKRLGGHEVAVAASTSCFTSPSSTTPPLAAHHPQALCSFLSLTAMRFWMRPRSTMCYDCGSAGEARPLCGQGLLLQQDRGLLHRHADEVRTRRRRVAQRDRAAVTGGHHHAQRPRISIPFQEGCSPAEEQRPARLDGPSRVEQTTAPWRASARCCRRTSSTPAAGTAARNCASRSSPGPNQVQPSPAGHGQGHPGRV